MTLPLRTAGRLVARLCIGTALLGLIPLAHAQQPLTWDQVKAQFETTNPALKADADNVDEMRAEEITAYLRPNPQFTALVDGTQIAPARRRLAAVQGHLRSAQLQLPARARSQARTAP